MKIGIVAGEPSGDLLGAGLIAALRQVMPESQFSGLGGPAMIAAGCQSISQIERLSVMGLIEPLFHLRDLFKLRNELFEHFLKMKPDVFIGIDSPDFNLGLELKLRQHGIRVIHYVSPSVWAWRQKRVYKIAKATHLVLTLFPFEADFYQKHAIPVKFVGHPLADHIPLQVDKIAARQQLGIDPDCQYVALLPGSRAHEIKQMAGLFIETAKNMLQKNNYLQFITSSINPRRQAEFQKICKHLAPNLPLHFFVNQSQKVMIASDVALVKSGTATLEVMLCKRPMVIAHRMNSITYQLARFLVKIPFIGLPNLLANECLVPEFIQNRAKPDALSNALMQYLENDNLTLDLERKFAVIHNQLRRDASQEAALAVKQLL